MPNIIDYGELGQVQVPDHITSPEELESFGQSYYGNLVARQQAKNDQAYARGVTEGTYPMPYDARYLPNATYPVVAGLSRGAAGLAKSVPAMMRLAADLPVDLADTIGRMAGYPDLAQAGYYYTNPQRERAEIVRERLAPAVERLDLPAYSGGTFKDAWNEDGLSGVAMHAAEGVIENIPQLALMGAAGRGMTLLGATPQVASKIAPWLVFPLEAQGVMEEEMAQSGHYSPIAAASVGTINSLLERFGTGKLLERYLGEEGTGLALRAGRRAMARQVAGRAAVQAGREGIQEVAQEGVTMNFPPLVSDFEAPPLEDQFWRGVDSGVIGSLIGAGGSVAPDAVELSQNSNRWLWDERKQAQIREMIRGQRIHQAARRNAANDLLAQQAAEAANIANLGPDPDANTRFRLQQAWQRQNDAQAYEARVAQAAQDSEASLKQLQQLSVESDLAGQARQEANYDATVSGYYEQQRAAEIARALEVARSGQFGRMPYMQDPSGVPILGSVAMDPLNRPLTTPEISGERLDPQERAKVLTPLNQSRDRQKAERDAQWAKTVQAIQTRMLAHQEAAEQARRVEAALVNKLDAESRKQAEEARAQRLFHEEQIAKGVDLVTRAEANRKALEDQEAEEAASLVENTPKPESKRTKAIREAADKSMQSVAAMLERMATGVRPKRGRNALRPNVKKATTEEIIGRPPVVNLVPPPPLKPPRKRSALSLTKAAKKIGRGTRMVAANALSDVAEVLKKPRVRAPKTIRQEKVESGTRNAPTEAAVKFYALMKDLADSETDPETRGYFDAVLKQFTGISGKVEDKFNREAETKVSKSAAGLVGETVREGEQTVRPEFLSGNHTMILNHVEGNYARLFDEAYQEAEAKFGKNANQQSPKLEEVKREKAKYIKEQLAAKWNIAKAYNFARNKALEKTPDTEDLTRENPKDRRKRRDAAVKVQKAVKTYYADANPWGRLATPEARLFVGFIINLYNGRPLVPRRGTEQVPLGATAAEIATMEPLEPYEEYIARTQEALKQLIEMIELGDPKKGAQAIFHLVKDKPTLERIASPPDVLKESTKGWDALRDWKPLTPQQQVDWSQDLTKTFGEAVAVQFRTQDLKDVDEGIETRFSKAQDATNAALNGLKESLETPVPETEAQTMQVEDVLAVLEDIFGKGKVPANISLGTNPDGAIVQAIFNPNDPKARQRIIIDMNRAKSRSDLKDRTKEDIVHTVYKRNSPLFRRALQKVTPELYREMQQIYFNDTFEESHRLGQKRYGLSGEALERFAYRRTHEIVEEEATLRVLITEAKKAKPANWATDFWTSLTTPIRNFFGLDITPREAALLMERSVNRFAEHEERWQDQFRKNRARFYGVEEEDVDEGGEVRMSRAEPPAVEAPNPQVTEEMLQEFIAKLRTEQQKEWDERMKNYRPPLRKSHGPSIDKEFTPAQQAELQAEKKQIEEGARADGSWPFNEDGRAKWRALTADDIERIKSTRGNPFAAKVIGDRYEPLAGTGLEMPVTYLSPNLWVTVRTKAFKEWFGDWQADPQNSSKVTDPLTGEPQPQYHGTKRLGGDPLGFSVMDPTKTKEHQFHFGTPRQTESFVKMMPDWLSDWYTSDPDSVAARVYPAFLNIRKPLLTPDIFSMSPRTALRALADDGIIRDEDVRWIKKHHELTDAGGMKSAWMAIHNLVREKGYDGYVYHNLAEGRVTDVENIAWAIWEPEQVKSTFNRGTFDLEDQDIRHSKEERGDDFYQEAYRLAKERGLTVEVQESDTGETSVVHLEGDKARRALKRQKSLVDQLQALRNCVGGSK